MSYPHRWYYAFLINATILILGFIYQTHPLFLSLKQLQTEKNELSETINQLKLSSKKNKEEKNLTDSSTKISHPAWIFVSQLSAWSNQFNIKIATINFDSEKNESNQLDTVQVAASGRYIDFLSWFDALSNQDSPVLISDFLYQLNNKNELIFHLTFLLTNQNWVAFPKKNNELHAITSPFCTALDSGKSKISWKIS